MAASLFQDQSQTTDDFRIYTETNQYPVFAGPVLIRVGWRGGEIVQWTTPVGKGNEFMVEKSTGNFSAGILMSPSEDYRPGANWASVINHTSRQLKEASPGWPPVASNSMAIATGSFVAKFRVYETVSLSALGVRDGPPAVYETNDRLYVSENGRICNDPVDRLLAAGIVTPTPLGLVIQGPVNSNNFGVVADIRIN